MIELESKRLHMREITEDDLPKVLPVHLSNPEFLQLMEGSEGEAGRYDLEAIPHFTSLLAYMKKLENCNGR